MQEGLHCERFFGCNKRLSQLCLACFSVTIIPSYNNSVTIMMYQDVYHQSSLQPHSGATKSQASKPLLVLTAATGAGLQRSKHIDIHVRCPWMHRVQNPQGGCHHLVEIGATTPLPGFVTTQLNSRCSSALLEFMPLDRDSSCASGLSPHQPDRHVRGWKLALRHQDRLEKKSRPLFELLHVLSKGREGWKLQCSFASFKC